MRIWHELSDNGDETKYFLDFVDPYVEECNIVTLG